MSSILEELTISRKCSPTWGGSTRECKIAFNPVIHLKHLDILKFVESFSLPLNHSYCVVSVSDHTCSSDCDVLHFT